MKKQLNRLKLFLPFLIILMTLNFMAFSGITQQQFTHVVSKDTKACNGDCSLLDIPQLNDNADAIIIVTPIIEKGNLYNHPIGLYYFKSRWNIMNLDQQSIPIGAKFNVEYVTSADENHFAYAITTANLRKDGSANIDHPLLNNNPTVQFRSCPSWNPMIRSGTANREATETQYNAATGRWTIRNINNKTLFDGVMYNIAISSKGQPTSPANTTAINTTSASTAATSNTVTGPIKRILMTVSVNGVNLPGDLTGPNQVGKSEIFEFESAVNTGREAASGLSTGRRLHEPVSIKKISGGLTTLSYFNALIKDQVLVVTFEFYSTTSSGAEVLNYVIKLSGAKISGFKQVSIENNYAHSSGYFDIIKLAFTKIDYIKDGVTVSDSL